MRWQGDGHAELPGGLAGAERCSAAVLSLVGRYSGSAAAGHAGAGGPGRHRRQEGAKRACGAPNKREGLRGTCQMHCLRVIETADENDTELSEFTEYEQNSACQVFDRMILASRDFSLS